MKRLISDPTDRTVRQLITALNDPPNGGPSSVSVVQLRNESLDGPYALVVIKGQKSIDKFQQLTHDHLQALVKNDG